MPRLRRNEWNFAANAAALISELLRDASVETSAMGHAESELTELRGARRLDLVIFSRSDIHEPLVTGELKVPWDPLGRTPYNTDVVQGALTKAVNAGAQYFITWNVRRLVVWKTDQPGVPLINRVVYDREIVPQNLTSAEDFSRPEVQQSLRAGVEHLLSFLTSTFAGFHDTRFLPIDLIFIARLEAALDHPIFATSSELTNRTQTTRAFKNSLDSWMREGQGWVVTPANEAENLVRAARFTCYVLVNRLCFYNALRRKYPELPRLTVSNGVRTGVALERRLGIAFGDARRYTGDYESVFEGDFGDTLPFLADSAVADWRDLIRLLDNYDFASINVDVIGSMYERLITPSERHRYGQHYTQPVVVDLMTALTIDSGNASILDPGCGGGTFLVGAYTKKQSLNPGLEHSELLATLYGCDILQYACHLTTINLAIRDLIDDDNFPRVHRGDFLMYQPGELFSVQPVRLQAGGLPTGIRESRIPAESIDVVIGNPPYVNAKELSPEARSRYLRDAQTNWPLYSWKRTSDIYLYFFLHAARFLRDGGRLVLLTQSGWMDGEFGVPLQHWMLTNFQIEVLIETNAEPWFSDARVATGITILRKLSCIDPNHEVRFVQLSRPLAEIYANTGVSDSGLLAQLIRDSNQQFDFLRTRQVLQRQLLNEGTKDHREYVGSRWGLHLRSPNRIYDLLSTHSAAFTRLSSLAILSRGVTTNCDEFFIVKDVTAETLVRVTSSALFRDAYGVPRHRVLNEELRIIKRSDGVEFALPTANLTPILKSARDAQSFRTSDLTVDTRAVSLAGARSALAPLVDTYVRAGEREGWHLSTSFETNREHWYLLRELTASPLLFPKTSQYTPLVLLNDANVLANQRLYHVFPLAGVDSMALWALLNSSFFAFERYTAAKSLGQEAAIDIEVFTANSFRIPDLRLWQPSLIQRLIEAGESLLRERPTAVLDEVLLDSNHATSLEYLSRSPATPHHWPAYFQSTARVEIDMVLLEGIGVPLSEVVSTRECICNELLTYTRNLRAC